MNSKNSSGRMNIFSKKKNSKVEEERQYGYSKRTVSISSQNTVKKKTADLHDFLADTNNL